MPYIGIGNPSKYLSKNGQNMQKMEKMNIFTLYIKILYIYMKK